MPKSSMMRICCLCAFALAATTASAQSDSGNMMKMSVTMKMQVPGAGDMPARTTTQDVCTSRNHDMRAMLQQQLDHLEIAARRCGMQGRSSRRCRLVPGWIRASLEEKSCDLIVAEFDGG